MTLPVSVLAALSATAVNGTDTGSGPALGRSGALSGPGTTRRIAIASPAIGAMEGAGATDATGGTSGDGSAATLASLGGEVAKSGRDAARAMTLSSICKVAKFQS